MTNAEWTAEIANALAAREKLRRAHNATSARLRGAAKAIPADRKGEWDRYRSESFLPASRRIEARICELRDSVPPDVTTAARSIVRGGKLVLPAGATWAERAALLEAAVRVFDKDDADAILVQDARGIAKQAPDQADLDDADIEPRGVAALPPDPYEDLTTFPETDPNSHISLATLTCTFALASNETAYAAKSYGAAHFGEYTHNMQFEITALPSGSYSVVWCVTNDPDEWGSINTGQLVFLNYIYSGGVKLRVRLYEKSTGANDGETGLILWSNPHYLTLERVSTTATCKIYSDAARTVLVDTLSITCATTTYEYLMPIASSNGGSAAVMGGTTSNFDIGEAAGGRVPWQIFFNRGA